MAIVGINIDIYTDNGWSAEGIVADFDADWEDADRSVGYSGGWTCRLLTVPIGSLELSRDQLIQAMSKAEVEAIESRAADSLSEYHGYGDLDAA